METTMDSPIKTTTFSLDSKPVQQLRAQDPKLGRLIDAVGPVTLVFGGDSFSAVARSIIGQQLSGRSASAIWARVEAACGGSVALAHLASLDDDVLRTAGVSRPKIACLRDLCAKSSTREVDFDALPSMPDDELVAMLTKVKGIGVWTCEMFMIFCLGRMDVFAPKDLGLRRAMRWLYDMPEMPNEKDSVPIAAAWRPYRTVASLYLWQAVTAKLV